MSKRFTEIRSPLSRRLKSKLLSTVGSSILAISAIGGLAFAPAGPASRVQAAIAPVPVNMVDYSWHDATSDQRIINAHPEFLISNSAAGPWRGNADISKFTSAGIKYFEYISGAYETTVYRSIPTDLQSNLNYITAAAQAGAYGIFVDEVSDGIYRAANYYYLQQIADRAHSLGLKVVFNTGMPNWADQLMNYCDYVNSSETWQDAPLTASQSKWASRTWLLTYGVYDAATASRLTNAALSKGIKSHYASVLYTTVPDYLATYFSQVFSYATYVPAPQPTTPASAGQTVVTFNSTPGGVEVWLDYSYKGVTPLTIGVAAGTHHIGFNKYGYYGNTPVQGDFLAGSSPLTVAGNMLTGLGTSSSAASSSQTTVSFTSNVAGAEVWLDYVYRGTTPLNLVVSAGSHHVGLYKSGYNYNQSVNADFYPSGQTNLNIYTDMLTGYSSIW